MSDHGSIMNIIGCKELITFKVIMNYMISLSNVHFLSELMVAKTESIVCYNGSIIMCSGFTDHINKYTENLSSV